MDQALEFNSMLLQKTEDIFGSHHALVGLLDPHLACIFVFGLPTQLRSQKLETWLDHLRRSGIPFRMGCSNEAIRREDIASIIEEAGFALKHAAPEQQVTLFAGLEPRMMALQSNRLTKQRFLDRILTGMSESAIQTLQAFFDSNLNIQETANALFLHKNTVIYRIRKVKEITGYDPQDFQDALALQTAIWIYTDTEQKGESS